MIGRTLLRTVLIITLTCMLSACTPAAGTDQMARPEQDIIDAFDTQITAASNQFGFNLFQKLITDENIMISPTSISTALSMTYNGARGETMEAMARALQIKGMDLQRINENNLALLYLLQSTDDVTLHIANSLWMRDGLEFDDDFISRNQMYYNARTRQLDFNDDSAADTINDWVSDQTNGLITDLIDPPINPYTILFLINATYFKGDWTKPFAERATRDDVFYLNDGNTTTVPFMYLQTEIDYYSEPGLQAVRLPYGKDERFSMYVIVPADIIDYTTSFSIEQWHELQAQLETVNGEVFLPKFSLEYEASLNDALIALGMDLPFDDKKSDLFDMVPWEGQPRLYISDVKHSSFIQVNEQGTEAAAATSVEIRVESAPVFDNTFRADRPFLFVIHDSDTDAILFMGTIFDPESS